LLKLFVSVDVLKVDYMYSCKRISFRPTTQKNSTYIKNHIVHAILDIATLGPTKTLTRISKKDENSKHQYQHYQKRGFMFFTHEYHHYQ